MNRIVKSLSALALSAGLLVSAAPLGLLGDGGFQLMMGPGSTGCCRQ